LSLNRIEGKIVSCKVGVSAASSMELKGAFKEIGWDESDNLEPQYVASKTFPAGYFQGHKDVEGELVVMTDIDDEMISSTSGFRFINPGAPNDPIKYFIIGMEVVNQSGTVSSDYWAFADAVHSISGSASSAYFNGAKRRVIDHQGNQTWSYPFRCFFVIKSGA